MALECLAHHLALLMFRIKSYVDTCVEYRCDEPNKPCPAFLADVPEYLLRVKALLPKKRRRRGVRGGRLVRLLACTFSGAVGSSKTMQPVIAASVHGACLLLLSSLLLGYSRFVDRGTTQCPCAFTGLVCGLLPLTMCSRHH
ncbi:hypothetical protein WMY93_033538 [Mugilogobius chulae]|uniref:Uncharacterized protein n=1 Tax=Mugilogobius chulae TaxID=88201 RepID=A0AAW0MND3_9GOBI